MTLPKKGLKKYDYNIDMEKKDLNKLTKGQLIELLLKQEKKKPKVVIVDDTKPVPTPRTYKSRPPVPTPRNKVNQLVQFFENKPTPPPRTGKWENVKPKPVPRKSVNEDIILPPIPEGKPAWESSQPKITQLQKALRNSTKSFIVDVVDRENPLRQLNETKNFIKKCLVKELLDLKGFKYVETLKLTLGKKQGNGITTKTAFFNSKTKTLINASEINEALQLSREELVKAIGQWLSEGSGWTITSIDSHYINLTQYQPLKGGSYIELPQELRHPNKRLINLQNKDECCFAWCHVRHLHPQEKNPQRIKKSDNAFIKDKIVNYDGIEFPVTIKDYNKIEKMNSININVFCYEEHQFFPIYISKEKVHRPYGTSFDN